MQPKFLIGAILALVCFAAGMASAEPLDLQSFIRQNLRDAPTAYARPASRVAPMSRQHGLHIVISQAERKLYLMDSGEVLKIYGIAVGRDGFRWTGTHKVSRKAEWPDWRPPETMLRRQPYLPRFMAGGPGNPLGARALYIGSTEYRIHGSNQPESIGHAVSSGCFRMTNDDVKELYERVALGTTVVVQ